MDPQALSRAIGLTCRRRCATALALVCGVTIATMAVLLERRRDTALESKLQAIVAARTAPTTPCSVLAPRGTRVLLALGQSNAGNHGEQNPVIAAPIRLFAESACLWATDPLPGSTGNGGSVWSRLPTALEQRGMSQPVMLSVMGVDATSIDDWTRRGSALRIRLETHLRSMVAAGLVPEFVLWQQGEADALRGTSGPAYLKGLAELAQMLHASGVRAPIVLAHSTRCRSEPNAAIRAATLEAVQADPRFRLGPDTDVLVGAAFRHDGCHLSVSGLDEAARLWADVFVDARMPTGR